MEQGVVLATTPECIVPHVPPRVRDPRRPAQSSHAHSPSTNVIGQWGRRLVGRIMDACSRAGVRFCLRQKGAEIQLVLCYLPSFSVYVVLRGCARCWCFLAFGCLSCVHWFGEIQSGDARHLFLCGCCVLHCFLWHLFGLSAISCCTVVLHHVLFVVLRSCCSWG